MRIFALGLAALVASIFLMNTEVRGDKTKEDKKDEKAKFTIKEVMKKAHAGDSALRKKYLAGTATADEKAELTACYIALAANTPPKGDVEKWKKVTADILKAYKDNDTKAYEKATDCAACHKEFKGKKKAAG